MISKIVLDSDGTLVNWQKRFLKHFPGLTIGEFNRLPRESKDRLFEITYRHDPRLFLGLEPYPFAESLLNIVRRSGKDWGILTAVGQHHNFEQAKADKIWNLKTMLGIPEERIVVVSTSQDKQQYAKSGHLIVDDFKRNCAQWEAKGGMSLCVGAPTPDLKKACLELKTLLKGKTR